LDYAGFIKLWEEYGQAEESHTCTADADFAECEVCRNSQEAANTLQFNVVQLARLLEEYHDALKELTDQVIWQIPTPRPRELQGALMRAMGTLNK